MMGTWRICLALASLLLACPTSPRGSERVADTRFDTRQLERALHEKVELRDLCFNSGQLKLFQVRSSSSEEFRAMEVEHLALLESLGLSKFLEPRRSSGCEVLARLRPGRLIGVTEPSTGSDSVIVEVRFTIEAEWEPWTRTSEADGLFDFPELPRIGAAVLRRAGGEWERDRTGWVATAPAPAKCRRDCEESGRCEGSTPEQFPSYRRTRAAWSAECSDDNPFRTVAAGECRSGSRFIVRGGGFGSETRYFDRSGRFVSLLGQSDAMDETCFGESFWPHPARCRLAVVTESFCGRLEPGAPLGRSRWLFDPPADASSTN
jgi:hypothetical protein